MAGALRASEALTGKKEVRGPMVLAHAPTYDCWRVAAHASPVSRKPHAARNANMVSSAVASIVASAAEAPLSASRAMPAGRVSTPQPTMFLTSATVHCASVVVPLPGTTMVVLTAARSAAGAATFSSGRVTPLTIFRKWLNQTHRRAPATGRKAESDFTWVSLSSEN